MTTYSLLFIATNEHIEKSRQIECSTDKGAVDKAAQEAGDYRAIQVWKGDRLIALVSNPRSLEKAYLHPSRRQSSAPDTGVTAPQHLVKCGQRNGDLPRPCFGTSVTEAGMRKTGGCSETQEIRTTKSCSYYL
jgi:hypothetical protein